MKKGQPLEKKPGFSCPVRRLEPCRKDKKKWSRVLAMGEGRGEAKEVQGNSDGELRMPDDETEQKEARVSESECGRARERVSFPSLASKK